MEAAQVFATVLADDGEDVTIRLDRRSHAVTRILWQQRFFEQALGACRHSHNEPLVQTHGGRLEPLKMFAWKRHLSTTVITTKSG